MSWKSFKFFDLEEVKDPDTNQPYDKLKEVKVTCCACGRGQMIFGDAEGRLHILTSLRDMFSFPAYVLRVNFIYQFKTKNIFLTVGDDEDLTPLIRVWNVDKRNKDGSPTLARSIRAIIPGAKQQCPVMAVCAHENMNMIAVGFQNGTVIMIRGNIMRDRTSRHRVIHEERSDRVYITGLGFRQVGLRVFLMVSTNKQVYSVCVSDNDKKVCLDDEFGCELNCSTMTDHTQEYKFVIAMTQAFHFYTSEAKAQLLVFEGEKFLIRWYRGYLISVTVGGRAGGRAGQSGSSDAMTLTIYDITNQFIAYQHTFNSRVVDVISEWGSLYVLLKDGRLIRLDENDTKTKLETLFKKNLYPTAISLAKSQSYNDGLMDIFTQYGDHLYSKGDYDSAIAQYIRTIGKLEPSYVIRKFLDAQRIHNLTAYLTCLHERGEANADHTTLLLNCYTKLKAIDELDKFVAGEQSMTFDVETAIKVCHQANYHRHALTLARKYQRHDWYLHIQLEKDNPNYDPNYYDALEYIAHLPFEAAEANMKKYGKQLMNELADDTTRLLISLCTDWIPKGGADVKPPMPQFSNPGHYIKVFVNKKDHLTQFLEHMIKVHVQLPDVVYNTLLELYLSDMGSCTNEDERQTMELKAMELLKKPEAVYDLDHALVLAQMHDFRSGVLYLYQKAGLFQQILLYYMEHNEYELVMETCKRHGRLDPNLWVQALTYFASQEECKTKIQNVLKHIDEHHLMPPLMVVQTLSESKCATLSDIKPYIVKHLQEVNEQIAKDEQQIKHYREDTARMREQISDLQTSAKIFQMMKCSLCKRSLTLPAVHFLCEHSFHQGCLDDEFEHECSICARDNRKVLDVIQHQKETSDLNEQFHSLLQRSADGFGVVADYFGRGVFNKAKPERSSRPARDMAAM